MSMKNLLLLSVLLAPACKKVVNVDLRDAPPQIVIEGNVTDAPGPHMVRITKTVPFSASNVYPPVTNATVWITDSTKKITEKLLQRDSGVYITGDIVGSPHHTYGLLVIIDGQQYAASSTMPARVSLDSISFAENVGFDNKQAINAVVNFQDPVGLGNYYQFTEVLGRRLIPNIFVFEDRLSDGRYIQEPLFNDSSYLQQGDTLQLTMNCIDKNMYNYYFTLQNVTANSFSSVTPTNPVTNLSGGALGYFSAHTTQQGTLVIY